jgi:uncharacterized protein YkwD
MPPLASPDHRGKRPRQFPRLRRRSSPCPSELIVSCFMRPLRLLLPAFASAATAAALVLPAVSSAAAACPGANDVPSAANAAPVSAATLCLLNRERAAHGLARLHEHPSLQHAATTYADLMVRETFFDHVSPAGSTMAQRIKRTDYLHNVRGWSLGENLAWGSGSASTPAQIVNAWMRSPGHRRNVLDGAFREIGIGVATGAPTGRSGATYVNEFGRRS